MLIDDGAWEHLKDFIGENKCIMFFNQNEEKEMFLIHSGNDLNFILQTRTVHIYWRIIIMIFYMAVERPWNGWKKVFIIN